MHRRSRPVSGPHLARLLGAWRSSGPAYASLARALRLLVLDGRLPLRTRLPGRARARRGARREPHDRDRRLRRAARGGLPRQPPRRRAAGRGCRPIRAWRRVARPVAARTSSTSAAPRARRPRARCTRALAAATAELPRHLPGPGYDAAGLPVLRAAIAAHLTAPRRADHAGPGARHRGRAARVARCCCACSPARATACWPSTRPTRRRWTPSARIGARPVPVPMLADGWDLDMLAATLRQAAPRLAYLIADHQNPTGLTLPAADRERLVALARATRTPLVIDETIAGLHLDGAPAAAGRRVRPGGRDRDHDRLDEQDVLGRAADRLDPREPGADRAAWPPPAPRWTSPARCSSS